VGNIEIAFVDYSSSKKVHLALDIVEYKPGLDSPMYDLIIGKNTMHDLGLVLDFNQKIVGLPLFSQKSPWWEVLAIYTISLLYLNSHL
jgi:hypothetical protein